MWWIAFFLLSMGTSILLWCALALGSEFDETQPTAREPLLPTIRASRNLLPSTNRKSTNQLGFYTQL